jgi:hypothetical protein
MGTLGSFSILMHDCMQGSKRSRKERAIVSDADRAGVDESDLNRAKGRSKGGGVGRDDVRIRRVPFATARPTFHELRRTVLKLVSLDCVVLQADTVIQPYETQMCGNRHKAGALSPQRGSSKQQAQDKGMSTKQCATGVATSGPDREDGDGSVDADMHEAQGRGEEYGEQDDKAASKVCSW